MASDIHERLLALAADARKQARELREDAEAEAQRLETMAALWESQVGESRERLTSPGHDATLATDMQAQTREQRVSRARLRRENRRHPFVAALVASGLTVVDFAKSIGESRSTVQSWYTDGGNGRPIPRAAAEEIRKRLGVPLTVWRRIVD